jgi:ATP-dependent Lon protease
MQGKARAGEEASPTISIGCPRSDSFPDAREVVAGALEKSTARVDVPPSRSRIQPAERAGLWNELVVVGGINLGGSIDPLHNAIDVVELAVEKGASVVLIPVSARKQLFDLSDDMATKVNVLFYGDAREALIKAIAD